VIFNKYVTLIVSIFLVVVSSWVGISCFSYFTHKIPPHVKVVGIGEGRSYKGVVECSLTANNGYKISSVQIEIDGKPLVVDDAGSVNAKQFNLPFEFDTLGLSDGKHLLSLESVDSSYNANNNSKQIEFFVDNKALTAAFLQTDYKVLQGRTFQPKIQLNKAVSTAKVKIFSKAHNCFPESDDSTVYEGFVPVDCEQNPGEYLVEFEAEDAVGNVAKLAGSLHVNKANFSRQKGFYIPPEKLQSEREVSMNNKILSEALSKWLEKSPNKKMWNGPFESPTVIRRISTPFGEVRITPERGRYLHRAVDIVNTPKSVVWASQNGKIIIKERYLFTGNTVVVDHGLGVFTKYCHLDDFSDLEVGDVIKKGEPVGKIGMTGYANGYHLHWELMVGGVPVDPFEWTKKVF